MFKIIKQCIKDLYFWFQIKLFYWKFPNFRGPYSLEFTGSMPVELAWDYAKKLKFREAVRRFSMPFCSEANYRGFCKCKIKYRNH